jgi:hypothetical protein
LNSDQRVQFLAQYAKFAKTFFADENLDTKVATEADVQAAMKKLKPQPLPAIRKRLPLKDWKYLGYYDGQEEAENAELQTWNRARGFKVTNEACIAQRDGSSYAKSFDPQNWRFMFTFKAKSPTIDKLSSFKLAEGVELGFGHDGQIY